MEVSRLWLRDLRCYEQVELELPPGVTRITGANGAGKTTLLEAVAWAATAASFRGGPDHALVRRGTDEAIIRVEVHEGERTQLVEAALRRTGRNRVLVNRKPVSRTRDLLGVLRATVFAPDDLELVKGGPAERRRFLDDLLVSIQPRLEGARTDLDRVLRQRSSLLRGRARDPDALRTLGVFDDQLVRVATELVRARIRLVERLSPPLSARYAELTGAPGASASAAYESEWLGEPDADPAHIAERLRAALASARPAELERGVTLVGPHRDELRLVADGLDSRTQTSQGGQRTLALALRLAGHTTSAEVTGEQPVLLLDDVFSELDDQRCAALVRTLPPAQTLVTSAGSRPVGVEADLDLVVCDGRVGRP